MTRQLVCILRCSGDSGRCRLRFADVYAMGSAARTLQVETAEAMRKRGYPTWTALVAIDPPGWEGSVIDCPKHGALIDGDRRTEGFSVIADLLPATDVVKAWREWQVTGTVQEVRWFPGASR